MCLPLELSEDNQKSYIYLISITRQTKCADLIQQYMLFSPSPPLQCLCLLHCPGFCMWLQDVPCLRESRALEVVVMEKASIYWERSTLTLSQAWHILLATYRTQGKWKEAEALEVVVMRKESMYC